MTAHLAVKRVDEPVDASDGFRVLVDRLWPRGLSKDKAHIDAWAKNLAPSDALRHWFGHEPAKWVEFEQRYVAELQTHENARRAFEAELVRHPRVTLLYAAHDEQHNNALALQIRQQRKRAA
ncbi:DUF488 domain-containing protein [Thiomonas sp. X19]|uniref:DUF488 domain-containing protein n=1 Tax=Thiomonas sp. X19 TaxID=1050370 RepID=UPI000DD767B6|nr:DUF488 family protein [Thiomonas sp. X19]